MSEPNAPEPTMEEILASIRRIISEDDAPAAAAPAAAPEEAPHEDATALMTDARAAHDDVLELTERVEPAVEPAFEPTPTPVAAPPSASLGDLDFSPAPAAAPAPAPEPTPTFARAPEPAYSPPAYSPPPPAAHEDDSPLIANHAADLAANHFGALAGAIAMPAAGRSLEDLVREMMRPMLKEWLDSNLAGIVETRVQAEVERISRTRR